MIGDNADKNTSAKSAYICENQRETEYYAFFNKRVEVFAFDNCV